MKKLLFTILFLLIGAYSFAGEAVVYSGLSSSDRLITAKPAYLYGVNIVSGASTAVVVIYDSSTATITSQTTVYKGNVPTATGDRTEYFYAPIEVFSGIYVDLTGTGAACTIYYKSR